MAMKVTEGRGWVKVECGTEVVVVGGTVLAGPYDQGNSSSPTVVSNPDLPPPTSLSGVSVSAASPKVQDDRWSDTIAPALDNLFAGREFRFLAPLVRHPLVITIDSHDPLRTHRLRQWDASLIKTGNVPVLNKYFTVE